MNIGAGHWVFAMVFAVAFIGILFWSFRKDNKVHQSQYRNSGLIALILGGGVFLLILVKIALRHI
jgi:cbb3-type cytochrome oxidase subunit 3